VKEWLIRLTLIGFGLILPIVALEYALSLFGPHIETYAPGFTEPDKYLGWKGVPNGVADTKRGIHLSRNSQGFRDKERSFDKKEGTFRFLVLGDSFTEAGNMPLEETFPYILEQTMNSESDKRFEVLNLGISGYGTGQEYLMLKYYGLKYQPDFVILAFYIGNDILDNSSTLSDPRYPKPYFELNGGKLEELPFTINDETQSVPFRSLKGQFKKFLPNIYYMLTSRISSTPWVKNSLVRIGIFNSEPVSPDKSKENKTSIQEIPTTWFDVYGKQYTPQWQDAWEITKALLLESKNELEAKKIGFMVVVIPMEFEIRPDRWYKTPFKNPQMRAVKFDVRKPERILSNFFETNGIDYLLLRPEFEKYTKDKGKDLYLQNPNEIHWNEDGHRFVAELIYKKLIESGIVKPLTPFLGSLTNASGLWVRC
jgi:lysophospholipase L1-like esterase